MAQALVLRVRREAAARHCALDAPVAQTVVFVRVHQRRGESAATRVAGDASAIDDGAEGENGAEAEGVVAALRALVAGGAHSGRAVSAHDEAAARVAADRRTSNSHAHCAEQVLPGDSETCATARA